MRLEAGAVRGAFFLETGARVGVLLELGAIRGGLLFETRPFGAVFLHARAQLVFETGAFAGELLFGAGTFGGELFFEAAAFCGELLLGAGALVGESSLQFLADGGGAFGGGLFRFDAQAHRFGDHAPFGLGAHRRDFGFEARRPFAPDVFDLGRPALLGVGFGGPSRALDFVGVARGELCQLSFEFLVQPATYRVDRRTKRIFSHFWHYRGG
jgi:hypothetical protein